MVKRFEIHARLSYEEEERVNTMCEQYGISRSELIQRAINTIYDLTKPSREPKD